MKYRNKPITIEAEQFFEGHKLPFADYGPVVEFDELGWCVTTIHGQRTSITNGDWIILEPGGTFSAYPCKPDIFATRYEPEVKP